MASTDFVDGVTKICASWLNDVNDFVYDVFANAVNAAEARQAIGAVAEAPKDGEIYANQHGEWTPITTIPNNIVISLNELTNELKFEVKYNNETIHTGIVTLS